MNIDPGILSQVKSAPSAMQRAQTAAVSEQAGIVFYRFQGRPIPTTRPWCREREGHVWHVEEIREWGRQAAGGSGWDGMVEGTNEQTIMAYLGGWYGDRSACRHVLVPVLLSRASEEDIKRMRAAGLIPKSGQLETGEVTPVLDRIRKAAKGAKTKRAVSDTLDELVYDFQRRVMPELSSAQKWAIGDYTEGGYEPANRYLRKSPDFERDVFRDRGVEIADLVQKAMVDNPLGRELVVFRGVPGRTGDKLAATVSKMAVGSELRLEGFTSTSLVSQTKHITKSPITMRIFVPKGTRALYLGDISAFPSEYELLLDHNLRYRFLGYEKIGDKTYMDLTIIP